MRLRFDGLLSSASIEKLSSRGSNTGSNEERGLKREPHSERCPSHTFFQLCSSGPGLVSLDQSFCHSGTNRILNAFIDKFVSVHQRRVGAAYLTQSHSQANLYRVTAGMPAIKNTRRR